MEQLDLLISCIESRTTMLTEFDGELFQSIVDKIVVQDKSVYFLLISGLEFTERI